MRLYISCVLILALSISIECRRVKVQPAEDDYYDDQQGQVVLVSQDDYNAGIYRQSVASARQDNYVPRTRIDTNLNRESRTKQDKAPPVQTIRNYNKVNDDGSFTFGYEAADGSFKEETRGTDCVVRGKYGYIDPDGNKREFTYVSGNPCDPNAKEEESQEKDQDDRNENESDNGPANYPSVRPVRPIHRPQIQTQKPPVTVFQNIYENSEIEQPEPEQVLKPTLPPVRHRLVPARPTYIEASPAPVLIQSRPRYHTTTPATYTEEVRSTQKVTPRPTVKNDPPTTYRPLLQVAVTPRPSSLYTPKTQFPSSTFRTTHFPSSTPSSLSTSPIDFAAEFQKFTSDNQLHSSTPSPIRAGAKPAVLHTNVQQSTSNPIYSSELVFDPNSGQYNTAVYQTLPQTEGDFTLRHRIQPYVHQPQAQSQPQLFSLGQLQGQSKVRVPSQTAYQQTQQEIQLLNSQQLFAQQQKQRTQQAKPEPQQFYYIQPNLLQSQPGLASGQIDAFLRGHNIQF